MPYLRCCLQSRFIERFIGAIFSLISQLWGVVRVKLPSKHHFLAPVWESLDRRILNECIFAKPPQ